MYSIGSCGFCVGSGGLSRYPRWYERQRLVCQILGITYPWFVRDVELRLEVGEVVIHLELALVTH